MSFYDEVIQFDHRFHSRSRVADLDLLEPITRKRIIGLISMASADGVDFMVWETYRSQERQAALYAAGATRLRDVGVHHYGLACDLVRVVAGEPSWKGDFSILGTLAKAHGLLWGGDWGQPGVHHKFVDSVHVQRCSLHDQAALFAGTFWPDEDYDPLG